MGLIRFLFITITVLWIIRVIIRLLLPMFVQKLFNKAQQQANNNRAQTQRKPEGSISIDYMPPTAQNSKADKLGDFVEYEEVK